jgi:hypothetical protein
VFFFIRFVLRTWAEEQKEWPHAAGAAPREKISREIFSREAAAEKFLT